MLTLFSQGHDIAAFCATVGMGRSTFFEWLKKYPIFEEAYDTAREKSRFFFEQQALHGMNDPSFNTVLWSMQMRNRFGYTEKRTVPIKGFEKAKTYTDQFNCVKKEVDKGNLTADEACKFASFVATGAQIEVQTDLKLRVDNLEKTSKEN
jgi:hypothetical protein